jgi:glutathione S-transferase
MAPTLYFHPLSSFCQKVLIALYENGTAFTPRLTDLGDEADRAELLALWPIGKFPVLRDPSRDVAVPESSIIIEFLQLHYPGPVKLIPEQEPLGWQTRLHDRFFDLYLNMEMQKVVGDRLRPKDKRDAFGVAHARARLRTACDLVENHIAGKTWIMGDAFTLADCAAAPALFYVDKLMPLAESHKEAAAYLRRLMQRPSYARVLKEAEPYFDLFPREDAA